MKKFHITGTQALREAFVKEAGLTLRSDSSIRSFDSLVPDDDGKKQVMGAGADPGSRESFTLPEDYKKALDYVIAYYNPNRPVELSSLKSGDWVVVLEEDEYYYNSEKCPQRVIELVSSNGLWVKLSFQDGSDNTYQKVRMATEEEIKRVTESRLICGYRKAVEKGMVSYGCKSFNKKEVKALATAIECFVRLGDYLVKADGSGIEFTSGQIITLDELESLYKEM